MGRMSEDEIHRRKTELLFDESEKIWWWLSFADGTLPKGSQFLGVAVIKAANPWQAVEFARYLYHCNPGGEVMGEPFYPIEPPSQFTNRLLSGAEIEELENWVEAEAKRRGLTNG